jgi:hypothetical protein
MYYYAEVLRGKRALRVIAIILGIFLAIAIVFRLWALSEHSPEIVATALQTSPTAHVTTKTLADGTVETTVNDPVKRTHAVIDRRGRLFHMDATMPTTNSMTRQRFVSIGSSSVDRSQRAGMSHIVVTYDTTANIPVSILFAISEIIGLVTATMLGGILAKENDGHLELAWTKPVSRERLALAYIGVDMATIVVSQFAMILLTLIVCAMFVWPTFYTDAYTLPSIVLALLGPIAWYAGLTAFSASLKRGLGMVIGLGWLAALVIPSVEAGTSFSGNDIVRSIHGLFKLLSYIDPIQYVHISYHGSLGANGMQSMPIGPLGTEVALALVLTIVYVVLAVLQWRRVEA